MERMVASVTHRNKVLIDQVTVWLEMTTTLGGVKSWKGYFYLPQDKYTGVGETCRLEATDGRAGDILVSGCLSGSGRDNRVQFDLFGKFG